MKNSYIVKGRKINTEKNGQILEKNKWSINFVKKKS